MDHVIHVMDLMPTFLSVAGVDYPDAYNEQALVPLQGRSLMPLLSGTASADFDTRTLGWSAYGMDAYRHGDWKVLRLPEPFGSGDWQLYDLATDPGELHDLASEFPDRTKVLSNLFVDYAESNGVINPSTPTAYAKPIVGRKY